MRRRGLAFWGCTHHCTSSPFAALVGGNPGNTGRNSGYPPHPRGITPLYLRSFANHPDSPWTGAASAAQSAFCNCCSSHDISRDVHGSSCLFAIAHGFWLFQLPPPSIRVDDGASQLVAVNHILTLDCLWNQILYPIYRRLRRKTMVGFGDLLLTGFWKAFSQ